MSAHLDKGLRALLVCQRVRTVTAYSEHKEGCPSQGTRRASGGRGTHVTDIEQVGTDLNEVFDRYQASLRSLLQRSHTLGIASAIYQVFEMWRSARDFTRFQGDFPRLHQIGNLAEEQRSELAIFYEEYTRSVSPAYMAISLELASALAALCILFHPKSILDLGSGFSSVVFRTYSRLAPSTSVVWTVDDSDDWLAPTASFLKLHQLSTDNLVTWDLFLQRSVGGFDLVFHDLGSMDVRRRTLPRAMTQARPGGLLMLDDIHKPLYGSFARRLVQAAGGRSYSLRWLTLDSMSRYAMLVPVSQGLSQSTIPVVKQSG